MARTKRPADVEGVNGVKCQSCGRWIPFCNANGDTEDNRAILIGHLHSLDCKVFSRARNNQHLNISIIPTELLTRILLFGCSDAVAIDPSYRAPTPIRS